MGTILRVDLTSGKIEKEPLSDWLRLNYLGGRGINSRILYDSVGPGIDALSPENVLIMGTGTVVGTIAPSAGRITVTAKSPLTGILGDGNAGGHFSVEMKRSGYDHIIVTGRADRPVYLWVEDDNIELRPAENLWGMTTVEAGDEIHKELGDTKIKIASIGPGGENLVKYASVMFENCHAVGRTGMGAVMGSKNLKAVAVRGTKGVQVAHPSEFMRLAKELQEEIVNHPSYKGLADFGTPNGTIGAHRMGLQTCKNSITNQWSEVEYLDHRLLKKDYYVKSLACTACPRHCNQAWVVRNGPYAGARGSKIEYSAVGLFGCGCLISDFSAIAKMNSLCDDYSIDVIELGVTIFGNILAEGALKAAEQVGQGAENYVTTHCKGMSQGTADARMLKGYALSHATSTRGADHLRGGLAPDPSPAKRKIYKEKFGTEDAVLFSKYVYFNGLP
jgi:aldehyde:ferredoxin oxidoreductase